MPYNFGDIVLVRYPFSNQASVKQRPAVIVSSRDYNIARPDVILMAITSQVHPSPNFGEVMIDQWQAAHLLKPSAIKPIFATIEQSLVLKPLGSLASSDQHALRKAITALIG